MGILKLALPGTGAGSDGGAAHTLANGYIIVGLACLTAWCAYAQYQRVNASIFASG